MKSNPIQPVTLDRVRLQPPLANKHQIPAKQLQGVENPKTVLLTPVMLGDNAKWWSYDKILLGGIKVNCADASEEKPADTLIGYLPTPIPRCWGHREFHVVVEYEAEEPSSKFKFRMFYGCGDPSELRLGETEILGKQGRQRLIFRLNEKYLARNELFRVTLDTIQQSANPVLIYGCWLEVGV